ncbi:MAG: hypothetical protein HYR60_27690 [Acidobacteria bacterium]|nr:hypothetical protein [Acidobacteriota bacterium]
MWKSAPEINIVLESLPEVSKLELLYSIALIWREAVYPPNYAASDEWKTLTVPSTYGEALLNDIRPSLSDLPEADVQLAYFGTFYHHELLFDFEKTDSTQIRQIFERELLQGRLRLPFCFGRLLYDRFNDCYSDTRTDHLMSPEVEKLLQGTPLGVYQLGTLVSGPLGVLDSLETRWIPPRKTLPLWHCSDTGCNALHGVRLLPPSIALVEAFSRIDRSLSERLGPPSEWRKALMWLHRRSSPARSYIDLPVLIADCIIGSQRTTLLEAALLSENGALLRKALGMPPRRKTAGDGPADQLASRLNAEEQLQLLLILPDQSIVELIDNAVYSKRIRIPIGETRHAGSSPPMRPQDSESDLSALGLRSVKFEPLVNLISLIRRTYQCSGLLNELEWRVRGDVAPSTYEALVSFVRTRGPAETARELILSTAQITNAACQDLHFPVGYVNAADNAAVNFLLWKLGFNPMQFDDSLPRFKARLSEFNETILVSSPVATEDARERLRAAGVNVFVSVEDFLDRLISYNVWLLSSDHFLASNFRYSSSQARQSVSRTLGTLHVNGSKLLWNANGENPLGTLLRYLRAVTDWIYGLTDSKRDDLLRPEEDLPHFASWEHLPFPFRHTAFWADTDPVELRRYMDVFGRITKLIEESEPAGVRNGLDHFREADRFPSTDKLLACVARLREALELSDVHRYFPRLFWLFGRKGNRFGSIEYEFRDAAGRSSFTFGPELVSGLPRNMYRGAYLLAPASLLGSPNSALIFEFRETSEYSLYWENYPRRRRIAMVDGTMVSTEAQPPAP